MQHWGWSYFEVQEWKCLIANLEQGSSRFVMATHQMAQMAGLRAFDLFIGSMKSNWDLSWICLNYFITKGSGTFQVLWYLVYKKGHNCHRYWLHYSNPALSLLLHIVSQASFCAWSIRKLLLNAPRFDDGMRISSQVSKTKNLKQIETFWAIGARIAMI